jgi:hypothetical protein
MNDMTEIEVPQVSAPPVADCALIYAALAKARGEFPAIPKNRVATVKSDKASYSYKYADLSDVFEAVDPVLAAYGITVFQRPVGNELETVVAHESGQIITGKWPIRAMKGQGLDTAMSYQAAVQVAKRYALTAMLGISTEETVEGDHRRKEGMPEGINEHFETGDGVRMPRGAKFTKDMTAREKAVEAARAIEAQFDEAKTAVGISGAWDRNSKFIDLLAEKHDDLFQNLTDKFHFLMENKS